MQSERAWTDKRIENILGNLLRVGVGLSALIVFCGGAIYLARHGKETAEYQVFAVSRRTCAAYLASFASLSNQMPGASFSRACFF